MPTSNVPSEPMCMPLDVRFHNQGLTNVLDGFHDYRILQAQYIAKMRIKSKLRKRYSTDDSLRLDDPKSTFPQPAPVWEGQIENEDPYQESYNNGLVAVGVSSGVYSDQWQIKFTSSTAFSLTGLLTRSNGTGDTSSDFTSTDTYITINNNDWFGSFSANDKFYFTTMNYHPYIKYIAAIYTAGLLLGGMFTQAGHETKAMNPIVRYAESLLDELADPKSGVGLDDTQFTIDDSPVAMPYDVDYLGRNVTPAPDEDEYGNEGEEYWGNIINDDD